MLEEQIRLLGEQSTELLVQLDARLPKTFGASFNEGLNQLSGLVSTLLERSNTDLGLLLSELKQALESSRSLLIERTEVLVPALDRLGDLGSGLEQLQGRLIAIEAGADKDAAQATSWHDEVRALLGQTQGLINERTSVFDSAQ